MRDQTVPPGFWNLSASFSKKNCIIIRKLGICRDCGNKAKPVIYLASKLSLIAGIFCTVWAGAFCLMIIRICHQAKQFP